MSTKIVRSRLIHATIAVAALASVPAPAVAATARAGAHAVAAQRVAAVTPPSLAIAAPRPRMI